MADFFGRSALWLVMTILFVHAVTGSVHMPSVDEDEESYREMLAAMVDEKGGADYESFPGEVSEDDDDGGLFNKGQLEVVPSWPNQPVRLGQIGGIAVDSEGDLNVFQRAARVWGPETFDVSNRFQHKSRGPIRQPTVLVLNKTTGAVTSAWGQNRFYLPHGMSIDPSGNIWLVDVAMHQVFKFSGDKGEPLLTLGKAFEPARGNDDLSRLCKPTDVAVSKSGDIFVSDGYCNSRIIKYDANGTYVGQAGDDELWVPHSLALAEDLDLICVADRENRRIVCFNAGLKNPAKFGVLEREYANKIIGRVFAIAYSPKDQLLYAVSGPTDELAPDGVTIDMAEYHPYSGGIIATWSPNEQGFTQPHDIDVSADGAVVYVGEIQPNKLWKFIKESA